MAPFRKKDIKWDGKDNGGQYKEKDGLKFDILNHRVVEKIENMPRYFLADSLEEAEALYKQYEKLLNGLAYNYSLSTNIDRSDLFGDALIGLARAKRDWNPKKSNNFKTYAIYRIKDALNECARKNNTTVVTPSYIKKANANLRELESICERKQIKLNTVLIDQDIPDVMEPSEAVRCVELVENLINASNRANVDYEKFVERVRYIPIDVEYQDQQILEDTGRQQELMETAMFVKSLKTYMNKNELKVCNGIMEDKSYAQIGEELGKSKSWVGNVLKELKSKIMQLTL